MIVTERFELVRPLGCGGYGTVHEAFDRERGERVAVKRLHRTSARALASFKREFRTLSTITHAGLPKLHDLFARGDDWFFSMELVEGHDLSAFGGGRIHDIETRTDVAEHASAPSMPPVIDEAIIGRTRAIIEQILAVLRVVHAAGFVHCDVKPANVRLRPDGRAVLLDFGLARALSEDAAQFAGTLAYAAPEQLLGQVTPACDLYALGALAFELLTGSPPFGTGREAAENKQRRDPLPLRLPAEARDLETLVHRLLSRVPAERIAAVGASERVVPGAPRFVGRADVLAQIDDELDRLAMGHRGVIVLEGSSGMGKTTLLTEVRERVLARGFVVLSGRAAEREHVPFNVLDGVADGLATLAERAPQVEAMGRTFPVLRAAAPVAEVDSADALAAAFRAALHALGPTVLLLDDVQWADADCERLLAATLAPPSAPPVLLVLARRPGGGLEPTRLLHATSRIELGPLSAVETQGLLLARGCTSTAAAMIARESKGHPLLVEELLQRVELRRTSDDRGAAPATVDEAIRARIDGLAPEARAVLRVLAFATEALGAPVIAAIVGQAHASVTSVLDGLLATRFARRADQGERPRFTVFHDRIGELVRASLSARESRALHEGFARALDGTDSAAAMCHHLEALGRGEEAARYARVAADRARAAMAFETEAWFCAREIALTAGDARTKRSLRLRRADALRRAGRSVDAADELALVADSELGDEAHRLRVDAARLYLAAGEMERGRRLLAPLFADLPRSQLGATLMLARERLALRVERTLFSWRRGAVDRAKLSALQAVAEGLGMTDNLRGAIFHTRAVRLGLRSTDAELRGELLAIEAIFLGASGRKGRRAARRLLAEAARPFATPPPRLAALIESACAVNERCQRPSRANLARFEKCEAFFEASGAGDTWILWSLRISRARGARILGDLNAMRALYYPLLHKAEAQEDVYARVSLRRGHIGLHLAADRPDEARRVLDTTSWPGHAGSYHIQDWLDLEGRLETDLYERRAIRLSELEWQRLRRSSLHHSDLHRVLHRAMLGRVLLAADPRRGEVRRLARALAREREGYALAWARALRAGVAMHEGDRGSALRELHAVRRLAARYELMSLGASTSLVLARLTLESTLEDEAQVFFAEHGVRNPEAWAGIAYPSFRSVLPLKTPAGAA